MTNNSIRIYPEFHDTTHSSKLDGKLANKQGQ